MIVCHLLVISLLVGGHLVGGGHGARLKVAKDLVDEIVVFRAGVVLGGDARNGIGLFGYTKLEQALRFERVDVLGVGEDVMEVWRRA